MTQNTLTEGIDLVQQSINYIKQYEPPEGYYLAFSGGKDSICIYWLCKRAGVKFEAHYHNTTIDPKGLPSFIRKNYPDVKIEYPYYKGERTDFYKLVAMKGLPRRMFRWCCSVLKEGGGGKGSTVITGVREEESVQRRGRQIYSEFKGKFILLPIYHWKTTDVWEFIKTNKYPYPKLYDEGPKRLGCTFCPLSCKEKRARDYREYPERVKKLEQSVETLIKNRPDISLNTPKFWNGDAKKIVWWWVHESEPPESAKGKCLGDYLKEALEENDR